MYNPNNSINQLAEYIKKNLAKGYTQDSLKFALMGQGYSRISVEKAIELANKQIAAKAPEMKEKPQITFKIIDEENQLVEVDVKTRKGFWKRIFG